MEEIQTNQNNTINVNTRSINDDTQNIINVKTSSINDDKYRLIKEFKEFLSLKPSDKIIVEQVPIKRYNQTTTLIDNVYIMGLACSIGDDNFIMLDDKIIHINCHRFKLFNRDLILSYKNKSCVGISYEEACKMAEKLINEHDIITIPLKENFDIDKNDGNIIPRDQNSKYNKKNVSVVMFIGSNEGSFHWQNFIWNNFRVIKKVIYNSAELLLPIRVGYYHRDKNCNICDDEPHFDYHEEMTREIDEKCLLLYASLVYKNDN